MIIGVLVLFAGRLVVILTTTMLRVEGRDLSAHFRTEEASSRHSMRRNRGKCLRARSHLDWLRT
jgi:hypothetical protein